MRFQTVKTEISLANLLTFIHLWTWGQQKVWFSWEPVPITIFFSCLLQLFRVSSLWKQQVHISGVFTASWSWIQSELTDVTVNKHCQLLTLHDFLYLGTQLMYVWVKRGILKKRPCWWYSISPRLLIKSLIWPLPWDKFDLRPSRWSRFD